MRKDILELLTVKSRYEHYQSKPHSFGKQTQFDCCFYLPDFKLSSRAISLHAPSCLRAFLKSTNVLSYRIGQLRTSSANLSSAILVDREEIWNSVILALVLVFISGQFPPVKYTTFIMADGSGGMVITNMKVRLVRPG